MRQNLQGPVGSQRSAPRLGLPHRKPWDLSALHAGSSANPVLWSRLPEQIFPLVTSPKTNTRGRASPRERESTSQEQRGFRLWRERCCFKQRCLLQQSKNSQAWKGRRLLGEQPNGKRPFQSLAQRQGVSSLLSGQSGEPMCVLPAGSPCPPARLSPSPWWRQEQHWQKSRAMVEGSSLGEGWTRSPVRPLPVPPTRWQSRHVD